jgi:hypothetical protein
MANAVITDKSPAITKRVEEKNNFNACIRDSKRYSSVESILPFRIKFTSIQVPGFSPTTIPAIPLQIIGFSNYIL